MVTKYAASQDRFLARREFHEIVTKEMKVSERRVVAKIQIDVAYSHCIPPDYVWELIEEYQNAGIIQKEGDEIVRIA